MTSKNALAQVNQSIISQQSQTKCDKSIMNDIYSCFTITSESILKSDLKSTSEDEQRKVHEIMKQHNLTDKSPEVVQALN